MERSGEAILPRAWQQYNSKRNDESLKEYVKHFLKCYKDCIDINFVHLEKGRYGYVPEGPHHTNLPQELLQTFSSALHHVETNLTPTVDLDLLQDGHKIVQCLIVIARNLDNVEMFAGGQYMQSLVNIANYILEKLTEASGGEIETLISIVKTILHFLECIYDPYFVWRKHLKGWTIERSRMRYKAAPLHVEIIPFFYECFQCSSIDLEIQKQLLHVFGAIITGVKENALKAICPATLDVLLKVLCNTSMPLNAHKNDTILLKKLVLQCLVRFVHVLHNSSAEQRQVEVGAVVEGYFQTMLKSEEDANDMQFQMDMLTSIDNMLETDQKQSLQVVFVAEGIFDTFVGFFHKMTVTGLQAQDLAMAILKVMKSVMTGSTIAKEKFKEKIGYHKFVEALKSLGQPSQNLLKTVLELVVEDNFALDSQYVVRNSQAILMLIQWLPDIQSHDLQIWLSECLKQVCCGRTHNLMQCCNEGVIGAILFTLKREKQISENAVLNLIAMVESLGKLSVTTSELKLLVRLLKPNDDDDHKKYLAPLMHAMSAMARRKDNLSALHYFDFLTEDSGIQTTDIGKWPGQGFTFHAWFCLDNDAASGMDHVRRQLYSVTTDSGNGFEGFFIKGGVLVIGATVKKELHAVTLSDCPIMDNQWHSVTVSHCSGKRPFGQSYVTVYIDGKEKKMVQLKFPSLYETFSTCCIGSASRSRGSISSASASTDSKSKSGSSSETTKGSRSSFTGFLQYALPASLRSSSSSTTNTSVVSIQTGNQDSEFGIPVSLFGQVGSALVFHEALTEAQVGVLANVGPNNLLLFQHEEGGLVELYSKLLLHYNAKASLGSYCMDLSSRKMDGSMKGHKCTTWDIKDVINSIGGIQVLFPLFELVTQDGSNIDTDMPPTSLLGDTEDRHMERSSSQDWVMVQNGSYADVKLEKNPVAGFLALLRNMIATSAINQETLVREGAVATLGLLIQKAHPTLIDVHVLMSIQLLVEAIGPVNSNLLHQIYQYLLFDFRVWSRSLFHVRIGHIQYLSTIIKEDKIYFRKKYGVQYMLDIIRTYYSTREDSGLSLEDNKSIRAALFGLIKFYTGKEIMYEELNYILNFIVAVKQEFSISEVLNLLVSLLEMPGKKDQIYLLLFEPEMGELLYMLLTYDEYSVTLKEKVLKVLTLLLTSNKVQEKHKVQLRLLERGMYPGMMSLMTNSLSSQAMASMMLDLVLLTETNASANAALCIVHFISNCDIDTKLETSRKLLAALFAKSSSPKMFAQQLGWQEILVRLLIFHPHTANASYTKSDEVINPKLSINNNNQADNQQFTGDNIYNSSPSITPSELDASNSSARNGSGDSNRPNSLSFSSGDSGSFTPTTPSLTPRFAKKRLFDDVGLSGEKESGIIESEGASSSGSEQASHDQVCDDGMGGKAQGDNVNVGKTNGADIDVPKNVSSGSSGKTLTPQSSIEDLGLVACELKESELAMTLMRMGVKLGGGDGESMDKREELCQNVLIILFTVMWKGVEGCDQESWKKRGQVFAALNYTEESHQLLKPKVELNMKLLELMLQGCILDLKETGQTNTSHMKNCFHMVRWLYNFLILDDELTQNKFNERIIEDIMMMYDLLTIWEVDNSWTEMEQLGLRILLAYACQPDITLCSIAAARLHTILQTRPVEKLQESCFVMAFIDSIVSKSIKESTEHYNFFIPVMKALVDKTRGMLDMDTLLPSLPTTFSSPTFFEDFKTYCQSEEWINFMQKMVIPSKEQYQAVIFDDIRASMKTLIGECHEDVMVDGHHRSRERGESKLKFQGMISESFKHKSRQENKRYQNIVSQLRNQQASALRQWRATKMFFTGERGAWADRNIPELHWKLSNLENLTRMRPKLIPDHNFDLHVDASKLRDNLDIHETNEEEDKLLLPSLAKELKVRDLENIGDDRLGDEEWNLISESNTATDELQGKEKLVLSEDCELVTVMECIKGKLEVTTTHVYFWDNTHTKEPGSSEDFKWALTQLREIHFRRFNLRRSALEFFLIDQTTYFINFQKKVRNKVYSRILSLRPVNLVYYGSRSPAELLKASGLTQKWVHREITNFEYLMQLNTIAGRTYNDLSQYPVFPWILKDYTSDQLDLNDPLVYRDLSKPIGVVNTKNEKEVREKYESFEDPTGSIEKFHYGTHYSNAAGVMHYLLRMEPFTTLHIELQGGKFDMADRQFHDIAGTWSMLMDSANDVKELIPEFFYLPEFLENANGFDLGKLQGSSDIVNNVILPNWAKSPEDFIQKHMKALECEHVSLQLHKWIDLIFGYKQKGPAAAEALNVFYYCTYEGAVDLDAITDPMEQKALEGMISNFGQTPCQLLKDAHPQRMSFDEVSARSSKSDKPLSILLFLNQLKAYFVEASMEVDPLAFICVPRNQTRSILQHGLPDIMVTITESGTLCLHGWLPYDKSISNYFTFEKDPTLDNVKTRRKLGPFSPGIQLTAKMFIVTHDGKLLVSGGHWDNSIRVYSIAKTKTTQHILRHTDIVSCLTIDHGGGHLMTGSRDTTCMIWSVQVQSGICHSLKPKPLQILYGHDSEVTAVQISVALDLAVSGSKDGTIIIHTVRKGTYMRTLRPTQEKGMDLSIEQLVISDVGQIGVYCSQIQGKSCKQDLHLYSVNGKHLRQETVQHPVSHMLISNGYLILGNVIGQLIIKDLLSMRTYTTMPLHIPITCLSLTNGNSHVLVGLQDGKLIIVGIKRPSEVKK